MIDNWVFVILGMVLMWAVMMLWRTPTRELKRENWLLKRENDQLKMTLESQEIIHYGRKLYLEKQMGKWDFLTDTGVKKTIKEDGVLQFGLDDNKFNPDVVDYDEGDFEEV